MIVRLDKLDVGIIAVYVVFDRFSAYFVNDMYIHERRSTAHGVARIAHGVYGLEFQL